MKAISELMQDIKNNKIPHFNVFVGEEIAVIKLYQEKIIGLGYNPVLCESVANVMNTINKKSFDKKPKCYIIQDDLQFQKEEKAWDKVVKAANSSKHIILMKYALYDKRKAFFKHFENNLVEFNRLTEDVLKRHISKVLPGADDDTMSMLIDTCESDYNRILLEADKINQYSKATGKNVNDSYDILDSQGVIYKPIGDITFKLTDAIVTGDLTHTNIYLYQAKLKQEPAILVLSVLYNEFRNILMYQGLGDDKTDVVKRTGLTPWQVKQASNKCGAYSLSELQNALNIIRDTEQGIKLGTIAEDVAIEYAVLNIM